MRMSRDLVAAALAIATTQAVAEGAPTPPRPGMSLVLSDEFERASLAGGPWATAFHDGARTHGDEYQAYLPDDPGVSPFETRDGVLRITARPASPPEVPTGRSYASGLISSHASFTFLYGFAEARIRFPAGKGLWPAFWMFSPSGGDRYSEIDVMEALGEEPGKVYATTHSGPRWEGRRIDQAVETSETPYSDDFHVYAVDWDDTNVTFLVDGKVTGRFETTPELRHPMHLMVNLAVGGEIGGRPDADTMFPATLEVDYVRVWQAPRPSR